jgi:chloride channel 7
MLAVMFAKWTGDALSKAIYEELLELKSIPFLEPKPPRFTYTKPITEIMSNDPVCIYEVDKVSRIVQVRPQSTLRDSIGDQCFFCSSHNA